MQSTRPFPRAATTLVTSPSSREHGRQEPDPGSATATITRPGAEYGLVTICIPTYKRPANLSALLESLLSLDRKGLELEVIVVDNDAGQSARPVVETVLADSGIPVTYDVVPEPSLPLVRNRLAELAIQLDASWIWFVDDDQLVQPDSLQPMLDAALKHDADCIVPRVRYLFEDPARPWAQWSGIFDEVPRPTGKPAKAFGSNGPLVRVSTLRELEPFDTRLALTGGEDSLFFTRLNDRGFKTIGCDEALLADRVHASRSEPRWLTKRAMRIGRVKGLLIRDVSPSITRTGKWFAIGVGYSAANLAVTLLFLPLGPSRFFRYWVRVAKGAGLIEGLLFPDRLYRHQEYAVIHGS